MNFPIFNKYFSVNLAIYLAINELILLIPITLFCIIVTNTFLLMLCLLCIDCIYIIHLFIIPFCILLTPIEFYLRKTGRIIKTNVVNIPVKFQKYIYIITALIYITITIVGIIVGQPMTEEELRYD